MPAVIAQVAGQDANTRTNAMKTLAVLRAEAGVPVLIEALKDTDPIIRAEAAMALGKIGSRQAVDPLLVTLKDEFTLVRAPAALALGRIKDANAVPALLVKATDTTSEIRTQAITALSMIGTKEGIDTLFAALSDPKAEIRQLAATGLARCRDERALEPLIALMKDQDTGIRLTAAKILTQYRSPKTVEAFLAALRDKDSQVRVQAATALGVIGDKKALDALTIALLDKTVTVRRAAASALGRLRDPSAISPLIGSYGTGDPYGDPDSNISSAVITSLRRIGTPAIEELLADAQPGADTSTRQTALTILGAMHEPRAIDAILAALNEKDYRLRNAALNALGGTWAWGDYGFSDAGMFISLQEGPHQPIAFGRPSSRFHAWCQSTKVVDAMLARAKAQPNDWQTFSILTMLADPRITDLLLERYKTNPKDQMLQQFVENITDARFLNARLEQLTSIQEKGDEGKWRTHSVAMSLAGMENLRDIAPIVAALKNENAEVRKALIAALGRIGDARAVDPLINLLKTDQVPEVREYAALSLGLIKDAKAVPSLIDALGDKVEWARSAAAWALGEIGDTRAITPLQEALKKDDPRFNVRAARAVWQLQADKPIEKYLALLSNPDEMTRHIAAYSLGEIDGVRSIEAYILAFNDEELSYVAFSALRHQWNPYALGPILDKLEDRSSDRPSRDYLSVMACDVLGASADQRAIDPLISLLEKSNDDFVRAAATGALARLGDTRGIDGSLAILEDSGSPYLLTAILGLQAVKDQRVDRALINHLEQGDPLIKVHAARALAVRGDARGVDTLIAMSKTGLDTIIRKLVLQYLGEAKDKRAVPTLLHIAQQGILEDRIEAINALSSIGDTSVLPQVLDILRQEDNPRVKLGVARALGGFKDPGVLKPLIATQSSPYSEVRVAGAEGLGRLGSRDGIDALINALGDEASRVRTAAAKSLTNITGQKFGEDAAKWRAWAQQQ